MQSYWNQTGHDVKVKTSITNEIITVKNGSGFKTLRKGETLKVKYPNTGWRKL